ncbi:sigma-70 family RNA polymerase sigma factor [Sphingomonas molluscorum]|nr:RNA polymerase subunit sigma-24 [Sphingomonas sp. ABOLF]
MLDPMQFNRDLRALLPDLSRYAGSLARDGDLAQDLIQETAIRAWRNRERFVAGTNFKGWLYRILRNCFLSHVRHQRVARTDTLGDDFPDVPVACEQESIVMLKDVQRSWKRLAPEQQRSIRLIGIEGRSYEEAAAIEHVPPGTIKSRVARGRDLLRAIVEGDMAGAVPPPMDAADRAPIPVSSHAASLSDEDRLQVEILRKWRGQRTFPKSQTA